MDAYKKKSDWEPNKKTREELAEMFGFDYQSLDVEPAEVAEPVEGEESQQQLIPPERLDEVRRMVTNDLDQGNLNLLNYQGRQVLADNRGQIIPVDVNQLNLGDNYLPMEIDQYANRIGATNVDPQINQPQL